MNTQMCCHHTATGMLSNDGRCKTLDAAGDGYVRAEDCIVFYLVAQATCRQSAAHPPAPVAAAIVVQGSAVNQDGRSSSLTAPNGPAQQSAMREALMEGGLLPSDVSLLELHGTGTALGDPIEVGAAAAVLQVTVEAVVQRCLSESAAAVWQSSH